MLKSFNQDIVDLNAKELEHIVPLVSYMPTMPMYHRPLFHLIPPHFLSLSITIYPTSRGREEY